MGLDVVELVMQTEENFAIEIPDDEAEQIRAVGDLYRVVLKKLDLPYKPSAEIETQPAMHPQGVPWTTASVWWTVKRTVVEQLQVTEEDVREGASFGEDLGAD